MSPEAPKFDITNWLTPAEAIKILEPALGEKSIIALLERLRGAMIEVAAYDTRIEGASKNIQFGVLKASVWKDVSSHDPVWEIGDLTHQAFDERHRQWVTVRHYSLRLKPADVEAIVPPKRASDTGTSENSQIDEAPDKRSPVSEAHLKHWYYAYQKAYGGTGSDTEPHALKSAQGMFPDKRVTREAVRKLRGSQKSGPKGPRDSST